MDKRIIIIAALGIVAVAVTVYRESGHRSKEPISFSFTAKKSITTERAVAMADTTLKSLGVTARNIRPIKNRNDIRVLYPEGFDVLNFISVMKDSLSDYTADIYSIDNAKEKSSVVQIKNDDVIVMSFIFSKEQVQSSQKGVVPSAPKNQPR
jgi:hypothetical protein